MSVIGLWLLKLKYKRKIKELKRDNPGMSDSEALNGSMGGNIKKIQRRILLLNIVITTIIIGVILAITLVIITMLSFTSVMASMSGNSILQILETSIEEKAKDVAGWAWEKTGLKPTDPGGSGGLYPKDPKIRYRAELLEILNKSVDDAKSSSGVRIEPAWILGTIYRETGDRLYTNMNNTNIASIYKDLLPASPACTKTSCVYLRNGISHYHNGIVVGGVDKGDPSKQVINTSQATYNSMGGDHAIGYIQFEIPYFYTHLRRLYKNTTPVLSGSNDIATVTAESKVDPDLGFIRPNAFALTDSMYNGAFSMTKEPEVSSGDYSSIIVSNDFKSLSEYNQNFIQFMYASCAYGRGSIAESDDDMARALITLAKSGQIEFLDDMVLSKADKYWDRSKMASRGNKNTFINDINSRYGLGVGAGNIGWYGVYAASVGKVAYVEMIKLVAEAEKDGPILGGDGAAIGNWLDHPGSGAYGGSGSKYYVNELGVRWYAQVHRTDTVNGSNWGKLKFLNNTMADIGCGIYALSASISNLTNKDITPDIIYHSVAEGGVLMSYNVVKRACDQYGLNSYQLNDANTAGGMAKVVEELKAGKMVEVYINGHGSFPWRRTVSSTSFHFILLKGVTADGKLLHITSTGNQGVNAETLMKIAVTPEQLMPRMQNAHVWVIGN